MTLPATAIRRMFTTVSRVDPIKCAPDLTLWPKFFALHEQQTLLSASLRKLDEMETRRVRRRIKECTAPPSTRHLSIHEQFLPDEYYGFKEGHFDGVINHYREAHLSWWQEQETPGLSHILQRLYSLCPTNHVQTHLLHLASYGEILPHVDNTSASGSWIMGVSLGAERLLHMEGPNGDDDIFDISLPSGSVYLQRDSMRYQYKHSILRGDLPDGQDSRFGQRLSIMIRDYPPSFNHDAAPTKMECMNG